LGTFWLKIEQFMWIDFRNTNMFWNCIMKLKWTNSNVATSPIFDGLLFSTVCNEAIKIMRDFITWNKQSKTGDRRKWVTLRHYYSFTLIIGPTSDVDIIFSKMYSHYVLFINKYS
jgi:hypothetical protein